MIGTEISPAVDHLRAGELVAIPTETVYGLAANALNDEAVLQIFEAKNRPHFDPLIVHIGPRQLPMFDEFIHAEARALMDTFWPGPLTVIIDKPPFIPDIVCSGLATMGLRMPDHPLTQELLSEIDFPLAAPSANPFTYVSPTTAQHVQDQLGEEVSYILDGGPAKVGIESTIVRSDQGGIRVLRLGGLSLDELRKVEPNIELEINSNADPKAPGQLDRHYATGTPLLLVDDIEKAVNESDPTATAVIGMQLPELEGVHLKLDLSENGDISEAARNLFAALRLADSEGIEKIICQKAPETGLGPAINDRLRRAAFR